MDAGLTSISGLTTSADKLIYTTASDTYATSDLTSAGRALLDDADAIAQRTTLGLGSAATSASSDFLASTAGLNDLSDVSFSAGAGIDNYVLTYDNSTSSWGAEASTAGATTLNGLSDVTITAAATGEYLRYSGTYWVDASLNIADDATPQLGGDLDLNGNDLVTTSNADLDLAPAGTGVVVLKGNQSGGNHPGALKFNCEQNSHGVTIQSPAHSAYSATYTLTLPTGSGNYGQFLQTDGTGVLSWGSAATSATPTAQNTTATLSTPTATEEIYTIDSSSLVTLTLADSSNCGAGFKYRFKRLGTGAVNITCATGDGIDHSGQTTFAIGAQYDSITLVADGSNLFFLI